ncbi:MAG: glycosyltransferase [Candidatus Bathyarchaeia archaeon]|jgi:glycosyltransferase involved in cell wall biosynthesis
MKVVMINDCAYVGETLLKYFPADLEKQHIKRTRGLWNKTFGIAYKILRAKGDLYHVHYLLQDCYLASHLGKKPIVGHAHGSDLRETLRSRKWGRIVKNNLKSCNKILVAQPTVLGTAKEYSETAEYFPIPFDPEIFYPKPLPEKRPEYHVFLASVPDFNVKGTDKLLHAISLVPEKIKVKAFEAGKDLEKTKQLAKELKLNIDFISRVPHGMINALFWESDLVLGSFATGREHLDTIAIEAMACGRPIVHSLPKNFFPSCPLEELKDPAATAETISKLLSSQNEKESRIEEQLSYVNSTHSAPILVKKLLEIYSALR